MLKRNRAIAWLFAIVIPLIGTSAQTEPMRKLSEHASVDQDDIPPDLPEGWSASEEGRKRFVDGFTKTLPPGNSATVNGTRLVVHLPKPPDEGYKRLMANPVFCEGLRKLGFTQFVVTDDRDKTLMFDIPAIYLRPSGIVSDATRKQFVDAIDENVPTGVSAALNGTQLVLHNPNFVEAQYNTLVALRNRGARLGLFRAFGFTQFVVTNDRDKTLAFDIPATDTLPTEVADFGIIEVATGGKPETHQVSTAGAGGTGSGVRIGSGNLATSFDDSVNSVGPDFYGNDPETISEALVADKTDAKSEFETTAQFEQRQKQDSLSLSHKLIFVVPPAQSDEDSGWRATYDADAQVFRVSLQFVHRTFFAEPGQPVFDLLELKSRVIRAGKYLGQNAYGATAEVSSSIAKLYGLAVPPNEWGSQPSDLLAGLFHASTYNLLVPMGIENARNFKPNMRLLVVCVLRQRKPITDLAGYQATIDHPSQSTEIKNYLNADIEQVWVYDSRSGLVIKKVAK